MRTTKRSQEPKLPSHPPVVVAIPNTSERKMEAIATVARALEEVAKALNSVNTNVTVAGCSFTGPMSGPAVSIGTKE